MKRRLAKLHPAFTALLALLSPLVFLQPAAAVLPPELDVLERRFRTSRAPSDFIIVVDTTHSMEQTGFWRHVKRYLVQIPSQLPEGSTYTVLRCESHSSEIVPESRISPEILPSIRLNITERQRARGRYRDIGESIATSLKILSHRSPDRHQFLVFILNGPHLPSPSSRFPEGHAPWGLVVMARNLMENRMLSVHLVALSDMVDKGLFERVFNPERNGHRLSAVNVKLSGLSESLDRMLISSERDKLRLAVEKEIKSGWISAETSPPVLGLNPGERKKVSFRFISGFKHLDANIVIKDLSLPQSGIRTNQNFVGRTLPLPAGGATEMLEIELINDQETPVRWNLPKRISVPVPVTLPLEVRLQSGKIIRELGVATDRFERKPTADFTLVYYTAVSSGLLLAIIGGTIPLILIFVGFMMRTPFPRGLILQVERGGRASAQYPLKRFNRWLFGRGIVQLNRRGKAKRSLKDGCIEIRARGRKRAPEAKPLKSGLTLEGDSLDIITPVYPDHEIGLAKNLIARIKPK
ncbi:hypothetical protein ACFLU6_10305 [Acidobacteriota bacterium]